MQKNSHDFNLQEAMRLAKSPAGKQILQMLQQSDQDVIQQASSMAKTGNYSQAINLIKKILSTPEGQKIMKEYGE